MFKQVIFSLLVIFFFTSEIVLAQYPYIKDDSLLVLGNNVYRKGNYIEAEKVYRKAEKLHSKNINTKKWIVAAVGLGASIIDQNRPYEGSKWIFKADSVAANYPDLELRAYAKSHKAWAIAWLYNDTEAIPFYEEAFELAKSSNNSYRIAQVSNSLMLENRLVGNYQKAIEYGKQAEQLMQKYNDAFMLPIIKSNLFVVYNELGYTEKAEALAFESLQLKKKLGNLDLLSREYERLGLFYEKKGEYGKALLYFNKHLETAKESFDPTEIIQANENVGKIYMLLGNYNSAFNFLDQAQNLWIQNTNRYQAAIVSLKTATALKRLKSYDQARNIYIAAIDYLIVGNQFSLLAETYMNLSELELAVGNSGKAISYSNKAIEIAINTESKRLKAKAFTSLSKVYSSIGEHILALSFAKKAFSTASFYKGYQISDYLINLSQRFHDIGSDSAFYYADLAFNEIERVRNNLYGDNLQSTLFSNYSEFYNEVAYWYLSEKNDIEKAFEVVESGKSKVLLQSLSSEDILKAVDEPTYLSILQKSKAVDKLYRTLENTSDQQKIMLLKQEIQAAELEYESFTNEIRIKNPKLKRLESPEIVSISKLQSLLDSNSAFIEYVFVKNKLITFWITIEGPGYNVSDFDSAKSADIIFKEHIASFRVAIEESKPVEDLAAYSSFLYSHLIEPFKNQFPEINKLVIIPSRSLSVLPFDALINNNRYLIEDYNIKHLPSASIYEYIQDLHRSYTKELLAVAGSGFESGSATNPSRSQNNFASLPASLTEVNSISSHFDQATVLKNEQVTESAIKALDLSSFRYLHFATHGSINEESPLQSGLIISKKNEFENTFGEDGFLNSLEISALSLNSDMVVLSACNTGMGKLVAGEGILGLQRSFFKAGASSVVVSLWNVYDKSTSELMARFYEKLNDYEKEDIGLWVKFKLFLNIYEAPLFGYKERALRDAKLAMLEHPYYNHPNHWAPFILFGK